MKLMRSSCVVAVLVLNLGLLTGCEKTDTPSAGNGSPPVTATSATLPANLFLTSSPDGAKPVEDVKASAKQGDSIVVRGRIGGSKSPFVDGRAVFTLMGTGLAACSDDPEDKCPTPWDYCCDNANDIAKHSATIQIVDASGAPIRTGVRGSSGLKELSEVVIVGKVVQAEEKAFVLAASGIYVAKP